MTKIDDNVYEYMCRNICAYAFYVIGKTKLSWVGEWDRTHGLVRTAASKNLSEEEIARRLRGPATDHAVVGYFECDKQAPDAEEICTFLESAKDSGDRRTPMMKLCDSVCGINRMICSKDVYRQMVPGDYTGNYNTDLVPGVWDMDNSVIKSASAWIGYPLGLREGSSSYTVGFPMYDVLDASKLFHVSRHLTALVMPLPTRTVIWWTPKAGMVTHPLYIQQSVQICGNWETFHGQAVQAVIREDVPHFTNLQLTEIPTIAPYPKEAAEILEKDEPHLNLAWRKYYDEQKQC